MRGKFYRLIRPTLSIDLNTRQTITIPAAEIIEVIGGRIPDQRMLDIRWKGQVLMMFVEDVKRCKEVVDE
jgi:hypothetical protein